MRVFLVVMAVFSLLMVSSCKKDDIVDKPIATTNLKLNGTGKYTFNSYAPLADKPIVVFYHIPEGANSDSPLLIVFHGNGRDAMESRDAMIDLSESNDFILVVPEFSSTYYPGSDKYHMGNIFVDGDNPSEATLNDESVWTFSVIEPIFDDFKSRTDLATNIYDVFGHSAGAQVAHRYFFFKPDARVNRVISASAGWYTMPYFEVDFPYGFGFAPISETVLKELFERRLTVIVGANDTDPNSYALRHTAQADEQGLNRVERANYFYNNSRQIALDYGVSFRWQFKAIANAGHDFGATSSTAVALLY